MKLNVRWRARRLWSAIVAGLAWGALAAEAAAQVNLGDLGDLRPWGVETWNGWESLGGVTSGASDCVATAANRLDCFTRIPGGNFVRNQWNGQSWSGPILLAGVEPESFFDSRAECVTWGADHIDCFLRRESDKQVFRRSIHGTFVTGWEALGGALSTDPDCVTTQAERLSCFGRGMDGVLWRNDFDGNIWSGWSQVAGAQMLQMTRPSCVVFRNEIHCLIVSPQSTLRQVHFSALGVQGRDMQGGQVVDAAPGIPPSPKCYVTLGPDLNGNFDDRIHCFAPRPGFLGRWGFGGPGSNQNWSLSDFGGNFGGGDWDCVVRSEDSINCIELIQNRGSGLGATIQSVTVRHRYWVANQGINIENLSLPFAGNATPAFVRCVSWASDRIDCFATGSPFGATALLHAWLAPSQPPTRFRTTRPITLPPTGN
jgi:hypothetical protein